MPSFKSDESFLEKISLGAIGTRKVFSLLKKDNHNPIELERGSMNYKIWKKIKIKRIRVPDILCVTSGIRVESRAKSKLEITMSHSFSDPDRGWDAGLKDDDYVALVVCEKDGEKPIDWVASDLIQFVSVFELRNAVRKNHIIAVKPKGASEGFEVRITWPSSIASADGIVKKISEERIQFLRNFDGRTISLSLKTKNIKKSPLVSIDDTIKKNQIIASVTPVEKLIPLRKVDVNYYLEQLYSPALSERYAAAKALSCFSTKSVINELRNKLSEIEEHIYVKLEIAASLSRLNQIEGFNFIQNCLNDTYLQNVLEGVIVLAEIKSSKSCEILCDVLRDETKNIEIRAGAAWGLGELNNKAAINSLTESFNLMQINVKVEAARALAKLTKNHTQEILERFSESNGTQKPGLSWALTKADSIPIDKLLKHLTDIESKHWISYIIGMQGEDKYITEIEKLRDIDPKVYFAVTLLWRLLSSWVYNLEEY